MATATQPRPAPDVSRAGLIDRINAIFPQEALARPQWVVHLAKVPYSARTGQPARSHDAPDKTYADHYRDTWANFAEASAAYLRDSRYDGVGYVFAEDDPYTGVDLDACTADGKLNDQAQAIVDSFASYAEASPSGGGVHILIRATLAPNARHKKVAPWATQDYPAHVEAYSSKRFFTVTGDHLDGAPQTIEARQDELDAFATRYLSDPAKLSPAAQVAGALDLDDDALIRIASRAAKGAGDDFAALWRGDTSAHGGDDSAADYALCRQLAFYTRGDAGRIERLWLASALGQRDKTQEREDYRQRTISNAIVACGGRYYSGRGGTWDVPPAAPGRTAIRVEPTKGHHLTDLGNAERFVEQHGEGLLYSEAYRAWLDWDGRRWAEDDHHTAQRRAAATVRSIYGEAANEENDDRRKEIIKHATRSEADRALTAMVSRARSSLIVTPAELDDSTTDYLLNCANGIVDLRSGEFLPHDRALRITALTPVAYDPQAECPTFLTFLDTIMAGDQSMIAFLQRAIGYSLTASTDEQAIFIPHGKGANGKSTLLAILRDLFGDYAKNAAPETFMARRSESVRSDLARLRGARLVTSVETDEGHRLAESLIKQVTGGDDITARFLYGKDFSFTPTFKVWMATNHKPLISGSDEAIWRRIRLIPFNVEIAEADRDKGLLGKFRAELPGILAWAVRGCLAYQREGLNTPRAVATATQDYRAEMDVIARFTGDWLIADRREHVLFSKVYAHYRVWADDEGERVLSSREIAAKLRESGWCIERGTGNKLMVIGARLADEPPDDDPPPQRPTTPPDALEASPLADVAAQTNVATPAPVQRATLASSAPVIYAGDHPPTHACPHCHKQRWARAKPAYGDGWACRECQRAITN